MSMKEILSKICGLACLGAAAFFSFSCAKSEGNSGNEDELRHLEAWIQVNHPGVKASGDGIYVLSDTKADGKTYGGENYVLFDYTVRSLDGKIQSTTSEAIAKQVGTYNASNYYGMRTFLAANEGVQVGILNMLEGMGVGETKTALIPSWLTGTKKRADAEAYFKHTQKDASSYIYELTLRDFTDDVVSREISQCTAYVHSVLDAQLDTVSYGFWYKKLAGKDTVSLPSDSTIYINYIGRTIPDGHVFNTNVADTAKFYGIYKSSRTYTPYSVTLAEEYANYSMDSGSSSSSYYSSSSSDMISGFAHAISLMHPYERGTAVFISPFGYGSTGSGNSVPPYASLRFDIWLVDNPND